jgi:beta-lactamase class A
MSIFCVGLLLGGVFGSVVIPSDTRISEKVPQQTLTTNTEGERERSTSLRFVSPLLSCGIESTPSTYGTTLKLRDQIEALLASYKTEGTITEAGVYYRELHDGAWFGINEKTQFTPGSLLKVPLALSVLRKIEAEPSFGATTVLYDGGAFQVPQRFTPPQTIEFGKEYSLNDLLRFTLVYSDNIATQVLAQTISRKELNESYTDLGIEVPQDGDSYTMSVRTYASFFRILYNGTYLSHQTSEKLLSMLSESTFTEGIVAGLPKGTVVAHKFGERTRSDTEPSQLHDCGIVYRENSPYLLCVMLRGNSIDTLPGVIADISKEVFEGVRNE